MRYDFPSLLAFMFSLQVKFSTEAPESVTYDQVRLPFCSGGFFRRTHIPADLFWIESDDHSLHTIDRLFLCSFVCLWVPSNLFKLV